MRVALLTTGAFRNQEWICKHVSMSLLLVSSLNSLLGWRLGKSYCDCTRDVCENAKHVYLGCNTQQMFVQAALSFWYFRNGQRLLSTYTLDLALPLTYSICFKILLGSLQN
jgi:hypothetical protein